MLKKIARLIRGQRPTLLETDKANELIDAVNALQNISLMEGEETKASVHPNGVNLSVKVPKPKPLPRLKLIATPPLMVRQLDENTFTLWIEGYTRNIKYCGGSGNLLHLDEKYNSDDVHEEDFISE